MNAFIKIRPVTPEDLTDLLYLAQNIGYGVTHLPPELDLLAEKIQHSIKSFSTPIETINDELYFFVMEDLSNHRIIGCCGIISTTDCTHPLYNYKITQQIHSSESLHITHANHFLQMVNDYQGLSEIGMLALLPEHQHHHFGKFLSRSRFLFLADNQQRVSKKIITQIRGRVDDQGHCAFWHAIGRKFIDLPFLEVDHLLTKNEERFISELLPDTPIPIELLADNVREVMGQAHPHSAPALAMLKKEGFTFENYINIFDGGPCLELYVDRNPTIHHSKHVFVQAIENDINSEPYMIATVNKIFCACLGELLIHTDGSVTISRQTADILNVQLGDILRISL